MLCCTRHASIHTNCHLQLKMEERDITIAITSFKLQKWTCLGCFGKFRILCYKISKTISFISDKNKNYFWHFPTKTCTHLDIFHRCSVPPLLPRHGSTCPQIQERDNHTSASTVLSQARMLWCNRQSAHSHTSRHLQLKMIEWDMTINKSFLK